MIADSSGLTVPFAILCIVDLFGIFPIVVLPGPIIKCGKYDVEHNIIIIIVYFVRLGNE